MTETVDVWGRFTGGFAPDWSTVKALDVSADGSELGEALARDAPHAERVAAAEVTDTTLDGERFDLITCDGALIDQSFARQHELMRWIFARLQPGGRCLVATETYLSASGAGAEGALRTPLAHLVFGPREVDALLGRRDQAPLPYRNPSCAATYLMLFRRAGFEIGSTVRIPNAELERAREAFATRLAVFDPAELEAGALVAELIRPASVDRSELRRPA